MRILLQICIIIQISSTGDKQTPNLRLIFQSQLLLFFHTMQSIHHEPVSIHHLSFNSDSEQVIIDVVDRLTPNKFRGVYNYQTLPNNFKVLFQNIQQFYAHLVKQEKKIKIKNNQFRFEVQMVGKIKEFQLSLQKVQFTEEEILTIDTQKLQHKLSQKIYLLTQLQKQLQTIKKQSEQKQICLQNLTKSISAKDQERQRLKNKVTILLNNLEELMNQKCKHVQTASKQSQEYTPIKKVTTPKSKPKSRSQSHKPSIVPIFIPAPAISEQFGQRIIFKVDQSAKFYSKFSIESSDIVQKLNGPTYQLFHNQSLPKQGKFYFDIKILSIKNNNIVVGVTSQKNKQQQFSLKKPNCICYNAYDGCIYEQDKAKSVKIKLIDGDIIRTIVDMTNLQIEWRLMDGKEKGVIGKASIPISMGKHQLLPYFQLYWQGNQIKLNI